MGSAVKGLIYSNPVEAGKSTGKSHEYMREAEESQSSLVAGENLSRSRQRCYL